MNHKQRVPIPTIDNEVNRYDCPLARLALLQQGRGMVIGIQCVARRDYIKRNSQICKLCKVGKRTINKPVENSNKSFEIKGDIVKEWNKMWKKF